MLAASPWGPNERCWWVGSPKDWPVPWRVAPVARATEPDPPARRRFESRPHREHAPPRQRAFWGARRASLARVGQDARHDVVDPEAIRDRAGRRRVVAKVC